MSEALEDEVNRFKAWADSYPPERRSGEWECDYPHWNKLYQAAADFLATSVHTWTAAGIETLLYAIARDNESEVIVEAAAPVQLLVLTRAALETGERDAKWQLAARLGEYPDLPEVECLLQGFADDPEEYVRRRALMALANIHSPATEALARRAWDTGEQYQRMACLHALFTVSSPQLEDFLEMAGRDGRELLVQLARRIRCREGEYGENARCG